MDDGDYSFLVRGSDHSDGGAVMPNPKEALREGEGDWRWVPVEPTEEMLTDACDVLNNEVSWRGKDSEPAYPCHLRPVLKAALAVAPAREAPSPTETIATPGAGVTRYLADRFEWAAPGDQQEDAWLVRFCDKDCGDAIFTGPDAEADAWTYWNHYAPSFNIYVFRLARLAHSAPSNPDVQPHCYGCQCTTCVSTTFQTATNPDAPTASEREAVELLRAAERGEGVHQYPVEILPWALRESVVSVLMCESEPHVVADAIGIVCQAAAALTSAPVERGRDAETIEACAKVAADFFKPHHKRRWKAEDDAAAEIARAIRALHP